MKSLQLIPFALILLTFTISCSSSETPKTTPESETVETVASYTDLTQDEFKAMEANLPDDVVILDVRTDAEVADGMIDGAIQIDFRGSNFKNEIALLDTSKTYVVYCRSGGRSAAASKIMAEELGFNNVKNLLGGYLGYSSEN